MAFMRKPAPDVTGHATAERAALAHAIAAHAAAAAHVAATDAAAQRASEAVWDAQAAITKAGEAIGEAREATLQHLIAAAGGGTGAAPHTEREARADLADAEAALDAARAARDALKGRLPEAEAARDRAARVRTEAARAVIAAEAADHAAALAREVEGLQRAALAKGAALAWLAKAGAAETVQRIGGEYGRPANLAIRAVVDRHDLVMQQAVTYDGWHHAPAQAGAAVWDDALAALERDPAAPLPLGGV